MFEDVLSRRFLFVVGKGGVGKTTVSVAMALAAARQGKRVLIAMCNVKERVSHMLEVSPVQDTNGEVSAGIDAVNMSPKLALEEYGTIILKVRRLSKALFDNRFVSAFLSGTPGLEAWAMLGKAWFHTTEEEGGKPRYDLVILDAPATGHGLDMLRVPQVIVDVAPPGVLRRDAEAAWSLFRDPTRSGVVIVTLPEDMPVNETLELEKVVREELGLPVAGLVVNQFIDPLFSKKEREEILAASEGGELEGLFEAGRRRALAERNQAEAIARLSTITVPRVKLPRIISAQFRKRALESLSRAFG